MENTNTYRTVEVAGSTVTIASARQLTEAERSQWASWFSAIAMYGVSDGASSDITLNLVEVYDILGRPATNAFPGSDNQAWIITEAEEAALVAASNAKAGRIAAIQSARAAEPETVSPVCHLCGTHCYGDCTASARF